MTGVADNLAYVAAALDLVPRGTTMPIVYAGFSQGVAMAFRTATRGGRPAGGVIAVGGDVPPELLTDASLVWPPVLLARGRTEEWYTAAKHDADAAALRARGWTRASSTGPAHRLDAAVAAAAAACALARFRD